MVQTRGVGVENEKEELNIQDTSTRSADHAHLPRVNDIVYFGGLLTRALSRATVLI